MVALKFDDGSGVAEIRMGTGARTFWKADGWSGPLEAVAERTIGGIKLTIWVRGKESPVREVILKKGERTQIVPGKDVPPGYFGAKNAPAIFIADE